MARIHFGFLVSDLIRHSGFGFRISLLACALITSTSALAQDAEPIPFYYAVRTIYTPQVQTLIVGVNEDVGQAIVSGDQKHVTLNMDSSLLSSPGVRQFKYHKGGQGFVGDAPARNSGNSSLAASPIEIGREPSILDKPGMVLIAPL